MKKVYLIGICGTGMSSLAGLFKSNNWIVGGSDTGCESPVKELISDLSIKIYKGYDKNNIIDFAPDLVIIGNIVSRGNPEGEFVLNNNYNYMSMPEALRMFFLVNRKRIVVAGTHGKTTSSAFLAYTFEKIGLNPGYFIGGRPVDLSSNYSIGCGDYFIIEGDEYETSFFDKKSKFLHYFPNYLLLKSIEYDHADIFDSEDEYIKSFKYLIKQVPSEGEIFFNNECINNRKLINGSYSKNIIYGSKGDLDIKYNILGDYFPYEYEIKIEDISLGKFKLNVLGDYNIENSLLPIYFMFRENIETDKMKNIIYDFHGVKRRQETLYKSDNFMYIDDFAHHPTSIKETIKSLKKIYSKWAVLTIFEPACWSLRKNIFQNEIFEALFLSDEVFLLDIKNKNLVKEEERLNINDIKDKLKKSGKQVKLFLNKNNSQKNVLQEIKRLIKKKKSLIILTLSNGSRLNLNKVIPRVLKEFD